MTEPTLTVVQDGKPETPVIATYEGPLTFGVIRDIHDRLTGVYLDGPEISFRTPVRLVNDDYDDLDRAAEIVQEIDALIRVQKVLAGAFVHRGLDGGAKAAFTHPLYLKAQAQIVALEESLTHLGIELT